MGLSRKPKVKFQRIGTRRLPPSAKPASFCDVFGEKFVSKPKFFTARGKKVFALGTLMKGSSRGRITISRLGQNGEFQVFAHTRFYFGPDYLNISNLASATGKPKTGFNVFRLLLNEAIAVARAKKTRRITLDTTKQRLQEYYEALGFRFNALGNGELLLD